MSTLKEINDECKEQLHKAAFELTAGKGKELPPLKDESSNETADNAVSSQDYHTAFSEICQAQSSALVKEIESWLDSFIVEIYDNQSSDWQHGFDMGEKLADLRQLIRKAKGEEV